MANSHTLGTCFSPRMWWADIEVPNTAVDRNSWAVSACYPRRTFYSLSDGPSIQNHRITKTCFRTCSTCQSRSQAPFCFYTLHTISDRIEGTLCTPPLLFRRRPPQSNYPPYIVPPRDQRIWLELRINQGGISRSAPSRLAPKLQSLPPILHRLMQSPM